MRMFLHNLLPSFFESCLGLHVNCKIPFSCVLYIYLFSFNLISSDIHNMFCNVSEFLFSCFYLNRTFVDSLGRNAGSFVCFFVSLFYSILNHKFQLQSALFRELFFFFYIIKRLVLGFSCTHDLFYLFAPTYLRLFPLSLDSSGASNTSTLALDSLGKEKSVWDGSVFFFLFSFTFLKLYRYMCIYLINKEYVFTLF